MYRHVLFLTLALALTGGSAAGDTTGAAFFAESVLPQLGKHGCVQCHMPGPGYVRPAVNYDDMLSYLAMGQARNNNVLIYKLANQRSIAPDRPAHIGGQLCANENAEPCASIMKWWDVEFGVKQ